MRRRNSILPLCGLAALACGLAACSGGLPMLPLAAYKIDVQQGNVVTDDMLSKLQAGMTRAQVRFILGTPLVVDPFRTDRWDYVYVYMKRGEVTEQRRFAVLFNDERLARLEGEGVPPLKAAPAPEPVLKPAPAPAEKPAAGPASPPDGLAAPAPAAPPAAGAP